MATLRATMTKGGITKDFHVDADDFEAAKRLLPFAEGWDVTSYYYDAREESAPEPERESASA
jgi:hypothetical protein